MSSLASDTCAGDRHLEVEAETFRNNFDERSFAFRHRLASDPRFAPERLVALAKAMAQNPSDVYYDAGDVQIGQRWDEIPPSDMSIEQLLYRIESANAWIVLRKVDKEPAYAALLDECLGEIEDGLGRSLSDVMKIRNALVFISSPRRITTYHIDRECSCLLQLRGHKTISIFDRNDREVLPEEEIERFWTTDNNAPTYRPELQGRATVYELEPGSAVHIPVNSPHWVQNGSDVSISLNINFHYHDRILADVYRTNHWIRKMGFQPTPPGKSALLDDIKRSVYGATRPVRALTSRVRAKR